MASPKVVDERLFAFNQYYDLDFRAASLCNIMVQRTITHEDWNSAHMFIVDLINRERTWRPDMPRVLDMSIVFNYMDGRVNGDRGDIIMLIVKAACGEVDIQVNYHRVAFLIDRGIKFTEPIYCN